MSTSILPISSSTVDYDGTNSTASQLSVFNNILGQLQQAIGSGNLTTTQTLLNAIESISPSSVTQSNALGTFLSSVATALNDGNATEAQSALSTYQSATSQSAASSSTTPATSTQAASASVIAANLIKSQLQLSLVTSLLSPSTIGGTNSTASASDANTLNNFLTAAYGQNSDSSTNLTGSANSTGSTNSASGSGSTSLTPYDTLISSIQASLAAGDGTITPALAYLQASGNFVNTTV
jgi:hypothetical protein